MDSRTNLQNEVIYSPEFSEVTRLIENINIHLDVTGNPVTVLDGAERLKEKWKRWISSYIDLSAFPYMYITAGATEAINYWAINNRKGVQVLTKDEYKWLYFIFNDIHVGMEEDRTLYLSNPQSSNGNYYSDKEWEDILNHPCDKVLDLAYINTTDTYHIPINDSVKEIYFSLSKGFGLGGLRLGLSFTKRPIPGLEILQKYGYFNHFSLQCINAVIDNFPPTYAWDRLNTQQSAIPNIVPSDSVILGMKNGKRVCLSSRYK